MGNSKDHYESLLAERYLWLMGGMEHNVERFERFFRSLDLRPHWSGHALDLGAGAGFQSIPLARLGFSVTAIDQSPSLLEVLREEAGQLPVTAVCEDMLQFHKHCPPKLELAVCMGDTLPHLAGRDQVAQLLEMVSVRLQQGGMFLTSFRDLNEPRKGLDRIFDVRSDEDRIFTCFLEYGPERVTVHDLVHERSNGGWVLHKGAYSKLRLERELVARLLTKSGMRVQKALEEDGMVTLVARKR